MRLIAITIVMSLVLFSSPLVGEDRSETIREPTTEIAIEVETKEDITSDKPREIISLDSQLTVWIERQKKEAKEYRSAKQSEFVYKKNTIEATTRKEWFMEYKRLREEFAEWLNLRPTIYDKYTSAEVYLMQRCVETECFQRSFDSKVNVAGVILNRINHPGFPNTPTEVITGYRQFAYSKTEISEDTILALEYAFLFNELSPDILFFHSKEWTATFCGAKYSFSDDAVHHFYEIN